jgi:LmbE family N-acetylglucosaminyl deacetylase
MSSGEKAVFVFPHQDDEMFIFHRIRHLLRQGKRLFPVWATDGAANNPEVRARLFIRLFLPILARESDEAIRMIRDGESRSLMKFLGIPEENLHFLSYPSGEIKSCFSQMVDSLSALFAELQPQEIYTVAFEHGQFEHDACNAAVRMAARELPIGTGLFEWPVTSIYRRRLRYRRFIPCDGIPASRTVFSKREEQERLKLFRELYPSQWFVAWLERMTSMFPSDRRRWGEPYRRMPEYDYSKPLPGTWVMYQPKSLRFDDFRGMVSAYTRA